MAEKAVDKSIVEIRKLLKDKKAIVGTQRTLKALKLGKLGKVFVSSNCPKNVLETIQHYSKLSKTNIVELNYPNDQLGILCKKMHSISVLSVAK